MNKLAGGAAPPLWWQNTIGQATKNAAESYGRRSEDSGCAAICVTVDNQYQSNRERNNRNRFDYGYMQQVSRGRKSVRKTSFSAVAAMLQPHTQHDLALH
jgi:isopentenyl diphosphate isomerase/L-lactate dehydrogenase-like FMN-dependent dehydrogenase